MSYSWECSNHLAHLDTHLKSGAWAEEVDCLCRGRGWLLSDYDAWYRCPLHGQGMPHPEEDYQDEDLADLEPISEVLCPDYDSDIPF